MRPEPTLKSPASRPKGANRKIDRSRCDPAQLLYVDLKARAELRNFPSGRKRATEFAGVSGFQDGRILFGLLVVVAVAVGGSILFAWAGINSSAADCDSSVSNQTSPEVRETVSPDVIVRKFLSAPGVAEKAMFTLHREAELPLVESFYRERNPVETVRKIRDTGLCSEGDKSCYCYAVALSDGIRIVALTSREDGTLAVDWKCFAAHSDVTWEEFLAADSVENSAAFRVVVSKDDYRNHRYKEEAKWAVYRLVRPGYAESIYGYAEAGSAAHAELELLLTEGNSHRFMLELKADELSEASGQVEIVRCLQSDWLER